MEGGRQHQERGGGSQQELSTRRQRQERGGGSQQELSTRRQPQHKEVATNGQRDTVWQDHEPVSRWETRAAMWEQHQGKGGKGSAEADTRWRGGGQERGSATTWQHQVQGGHTNYQPATTNRQNQDRRVGVSVRPPGTRRSGEGSVRSEIGGRPPSGQGRSGEAVRTGSRKSLESGLKGHQDKDTFSWNPNSVAVKKYDKNKYMVGHGRE